MGPLITSSWPEVLVPDSELPPSDESINEANAARSAPKESMVRTNSCGGVNSADIIHDTCRCRARPNTAILVRESEHRRVVFVQDPDKLGRRAPR